MARPVRRFGYRLALALGRADVDGLLSELTSRQLTEWMAYSRLEPFGPNEAEWRMGHLMSLLANLFRPKTNRNGYEAGDFMRDFAKEVRMDQAEAKHGNYTPQTQEELVRKFSTAMAAFGGSRKRK